MTLGGQVYGLGRAWAKRQVEITFDPSDQHLVFRSAQEAPIKRLPIQGITVSALIGELGPFVNLPAFQLALLMTWNAWRMLRLTDTLGGAASALRRGQLSPALGEPPDLDEGVQDDFIAEAIGTVRSHAKTPRDGWLRHTVPG